MLFAAHFRCLNSTRFARTYFARIFAINAVGIILASRFSSRYLAKYPAHRILKAANLLQCACGAALVIAAYTGWGGVAALWVPLFFYVGSIGVSFPNGSAIALARHGKIAGIASALLGTNQFGLAVVSTTVLSWLPHETAMPMAAIIFVCGGLAAIMNFTLLRGAAIR